MSWYNAETYSDKLWNQRVTDHKLEDTYLHPIDKWIDTLVIHLLEDTYLKMKAKLHRSTDTELKGW